MGKIDGETRAYFSVTLRDFYAASALIGILTGTSFKDETADGYATRAFGMADAMIEARREKKNGQQS